MGYGARPCVHIVHLIVIYKGKIACFYKSGFFCLFVSLADLRKNEKEEMQRVSYVQNANTSIASIIPTLATVLTFIVHTSLGLSLNTSDVSLTAEQQMQYWHLCQCPLCDLSGL